MAESRSRAALRTVLRIVCDLLRLVAASGRSHAQLAAENLFLKKQLSLYVERQVRPHRADDATRIALVALSWLIEWRPHPRGREAGYAHPMASKRFPVVLALEVTASWATAIAGRPAAADR
jgi:hypothetical protein